MSQNQIQMQMNCFEARSFFLDLVLQSVVSCLVKLFINNLSQCNFVFSMSVGKCMLTFIFKLFEIGLIFIKRGKFSFLLVLVRELEF